MAIKPRQVFSAEVVMEERARIAAILESPEGKRNPSAAMEFALRSDMKPDQANAILGQLPAANPYLEAMKAEVIGIMPGSTTAEALGMTTEGGAKEARLAELQQAANSVNTAKGYRRKTRA